jgi:hypothetical protein
MSEGDGSRRVRTWQEIAEEASREKEPKNLIELTAELECVMAERDSRLKKNAVQAE